MHDLNFSKTQLLNAIGSLFLRWHTGLVANISSALFQLESGVSILLAITQSLRSRKLEAYATESNPKFKSEQSTKHCLIIGNTSPKRQRVNGKCTGNSFAGDSGSN